MARQIAAKSPLAVAGSKMALNLARDHGTASALQQMTLLQSAIFDTTEMAEARRVEGQARRRVRALAPILDLSAACKRRRLC